VSYEQILGSEMNDSIDFANFLANQKPLWERNKSRVKFGYSPRLVGFYVNEIVKRVDPFHRNVRQFFNEEIGIPYGIDFQYGVTDDSKIENLATLHRLSNKETQKKLNVAMKTRQEFFQVLNDKSSPTYRSFNCFSFRYNFNKPEIQRLLVPSEMGLGTSAGVAKMFDLFSNHNIISPGTTTRALETEVEGRCSLLYHDMILSKGGYMKSSVYKNAFFHSGFGGSLGWGDQNLGIGVGYTTNTLDTVSEIDSRREILIEEIYKSMERFNPNKNMRIYNINRSKM